MGASAILGLGYVFPWVPFFVFFLLVAKFDGIILRAFCFVE
jgi:hypothetical protein